MPSAAILTLNGCYASSATGFADVLQVANSHLLRQGKSEDTYKWRFVSASGETVSASNGMSLQTHQVKAKDRFDLVFIPSIHYPGSRAFGQLLKREESSCEWLARKWQDGALIAANCTGTFLLAQTHLLDQRIATTTWWLERQFRELYPLVDLQMRPILTEADRLICAGASASYLLQAIRVIESFSGRLISTRTAKTMLIDVSQNTQTPYLPLLVEKEHADSLVNNAQQWLHSNMAQELRLADMAKALCVSEKTIARRFRSALDTTPVRYLQNLRIDAARTLLELGDLNIDQIAAQVGYTDSSSFSRLFRERMGVSPGNYRSRFESPRLN